MNPFDYMEWKDETGDHRLTRAEFEELPLTSRVKVLLHRRPLFFCNGERVKPIEAMSRLLAAKTNKPAR